MSSKAVFRPALFISSLLLANVGYAEQLRQFIKDHGRYATVATTNRPRMSWEHCISRMSHRMRRARSTNYTISS